MISPSTEKYDRSGKREIYAQAGVSHLWFVNPDTRTLEAFELRDSQWVLLATRTDAAGISLAPFDAITFPLNNLWPD